MSNKYEITIGFQSYYRETTAVSVIADDKEQAEKDALKYVRDHFGKFDDEGQRVDATLNHEGEMVVQFKQTALTKKPRFAVDELTDCGTCDGPPTEAVIEESDAAEEGEAAAIVDVTVEADISEDDTSAE